LKKFGVENFEDYKKAVKAFALADNKVYTFLLPFFTTLIKNDEMNEKSISDLRDASEMIASKHGLKKGFGSLLITITGMGMVAPLISAHFHFVRYPDRELKPTDYNDKMGIIQVLPELLSLVEYASNKLKKYS
jgi:hypothetical protein